MKRTNNYYLKAIDKIKENKVYKSFRYLCDDIGIDYRTHNRGGNKIRFMSLIEKKYNIEKDGWKLIFTRKTIDEIKEIDNYSKIRNILKRRRFNRVIYNYIIQYYENIDKNTTYIDLLKSNILPFEYYIFINYYTELKVTEENRFKTSMKKGLELSLECVLNNNIKKRTIIKSMESSNLNNPIKIKDLSILSTFNCKYDKIDFGKLPQKIKINGVYFIQKSYTINKNGTKVKSFRYKNNIKNNIFDYCDIIDEVIDKKYYIYKYIDKLSKRVYIGQTSDLKTRQINRFGSPQTPFDNLIRMIGLDNFCFRVIDYSDDYEEILKLEAKYIEKYDSYNNGYNMNSGTTNT